MITYEDIEKVNSEIPVVDIKGKDYATVAARIQAFRKLFPNGTIETKERMMPSIITRNDEGIIIREQRVVRFTACIFNDGRLLATGNAEEIEGSSNINKSSFIENCETSAVGRALGFLGIGSTDDIASAEEVVNAQGYDKISKEKADVLRGYVKQKGKDEAYICKFHKVNKFEDMTTRQYAEVVKWLGVL